MLKVRIIGYAHLHRKLRLVESNVKCLAKKIYM
jgi:hypothetical protein